MVTVDVSSLSEVGKYVVVRDGATFGDVFLCRIHAPARQPRGAVDVGGGQYIVGFSRKCTHMSCYLVADNVPTGTAADLPTKDGLLSCNCHSSCFDLASDGLTVVGPATDALASVELKALDNPVTRVEIVRWQRDRSVPYGVPYGGTSRNPPANDHA
jgi:Rieske Fe-S protein